MMEAVSKDDIKTYDTYCYQCVSGPEIVTVTVKNGVATKISPCHRAGEVHPGGGKACVKAFGLIQKTYNPHRLTTPMKRTNPKKGRNEDPGFVPISWDEALDIVADKFKSVRAKGALDESGYPRLAASLGGGGTPLSYAGTLSALFAAWGGPIDFSFGSGQGVKCTHSEHLYGELWHRGFTVCPDTPNTKFVISFGASTETASGVCGVKRHADARVGGMKRVQVEPHLSVTGGCATEWVPIKPKTDAAMLFALVNVVVHENARNRLDLAFLKDRTSSPYLVAPNGFYLRDAKSEKPLIWDEASASAVPYDTEGAKPALEGSFSVSGIETGADGQTWTHKNVECKTAFHVMLDQMKQYTPEWAGEICGVDAGKIRALANEYLDNAGIGKTIEIDGQTLPLRPVAITLGKTVNNGWGGYECCWARTMMACLVGALEVPGGLLGTTVRVNHSARDRRKSVEPGPDGLMYFPFNPTDKEKWVSDPDQRHAGRMLVPLVGNSGWSPALGPTSLAWSAQIDGPQAQMPEMTIPEIWVTFRTNPVVSYWNTDKLADAVAKFPFIVDFAYCHDETNHFADILLPEGTDLESTQITRIGGTKFVESFWRHQGFAVRQAAIEPLGDVRDITWISTEIAKRTGILEAYNTAINKGALSVPLRTKVYDFSLDPTKEHSVDEIWDAACRAASAEVTKGEETDGLDYFKEHGYRVAPFPQVNWYLTPTLVEQNLRYEMPYQERLLRVGAELGNRLHERGIDWWDKQLKEYQAIPTWHNFPGIWEDALEEAFDCKIGDYPFWLMTARSMQYSWGANAGIQMIKEVADNIAGHDGFIMNTGRARALGINDGDMVEVSSPNGQVVSGAAVLRQGIRPDCLLMLAQFNHWKTPLAKDFKNMPSMNRLIPMLNDTIDATGSGADLVRVQIKPAGGSR